MNEIDNQFYFAKLLGVELNWPDGDNYKCT